MVFLGRYVPGARLALGWCQGPRAPQVSRRPLFAHALQEHNSEPNPALLLSKLSKSMMELRRMKLLVDCEPEPALLSMAAFAAAVPQLSAQAPPRCLGCVSEWH